MPKPPERRRPTDPRQAAEAMFKPVPKLGEAVVKAPALPNAKEAVSLRIDRDILDRFRKDGPGWQDRINEALRKAVDAGSS